MAKQVYPVFDKVLTLGPSRKYGKGGIASVLASYGENFEPFHHLSTNSAHGTLPGLLRLAITVVRMPFARLKGRKIAHFHYAAGKSWYRKSFLMAWARLLGYKVVAHCHTGHIIAFSKKIGPAKISKVLNKATVNIVLSRSWKNYFETHLGVADSFIVNNIVQPVAPESESDRNDRPLTFLFLGLIGDNKGIFDILRAAGILKNEGYDFRLIVGGNGEIDRLRSQIRELDLADRVDFRGWISGEDKNVAFAQSDVLLLPSHNEGLPISVLEAMARGKAVISSAVGGIPEIITDGINGRLVTPGDVMDIADAMRAYIKHPDVAVEHGRASLPRITAFYPEQVGARLAAIYNKILSE